MSRDVTEADDVMTGPQDIYLFNFPKTSVRQVLLGERATRNLQQTIIQVLNADEKYAGVDVFQVSTDTRTFALQMVSIPRH